MMLVIHRATRIVVSAVALSCVACSSHSTPLQVEIGGELSRLGRPIAGKVVVLLPDGTEVASAHSRLPGPTFEIVVPSGNTYTIRGTSDDNAACGPVTIAIPRLKVPASPEPPWSVDHVSCAARQ